MPMIDPDRLRSLALRFDSDKPCSVCGCDVGAPHAPECMPPAPPRTPTAKATRKARAQLLRRASLPDLRRPVVSLPEGARILDADGDLWIITNTGATALVGQRGREVEWSRIDLPESDDLFGPFALLETPST